MKTVKITQTPILAQATETTNILVEQDGVTSRISADKIANNNADIHAKYFQISDDGVITLKREYRGAATKDNYENAVSDMDLGVAGSLNALLPDHLIIPEIVDGKAVTSLGTAIFRYNNAIKNVTLPSTITSVPDLCFDSCLYLKNVYNTEHITSVGNAAFQKSGIVFANFPSLEALGANTFFECLEIVFADIGKVNELGGLVFYGCKKLNRVKSENPITKVGNKCFTGTHNLQHADFSGLTSAGASAFLRSGVDFPEGLNTSGFGTDETYLQYSPVDYWSDRTFTPCENPLPTHLCQEDERWTNREIGTSGKTYSEGCLFFSIMHIYCGLKKIHWSTVYEMEAEVERKDPTWLDSFIPEMDADAEEQMEKLGLSAIPYGLSDSATVATLNEDNLQDLYDALAANKYVLMGYDEDFNHVVVIYGVNEKGELLVADSENASWTNGKREPLKYALPIYKLRAQENRIANVSAFYVVSLKEE